jgi:hypothetical protein
MVNRMGLGYGLVITVLLPVALFLFNILRFEQAVAAMLLLSGLWALAFGLFMQKSGERLYYAGFGVIVALLSTFILLPLAFTAGLIILAIVALVLVQQFKPGITPAAPGS